MMQLLVLKPQMTICRKVLQTLTRDVYIRTTAVYTIPRTKGLGDEMDRGNDILVRSNDKPPQ